MTHLQEYDLLVDKVLTEIEAEVIHLGRKFSLCTEQDLEDYTDEFYELPNSLFTDLSEDSIRVKVYALEVDEYNELLFHCIDGDDNHHQLISDDLLYDRCFFDILDRIKSGNVY